MAAPAPGLWGCLWGGQTRYVLSLWAHCLYAILPESMRPLVAVSIRRRFATCQETTQGLIREVSRSACAKYPPLWRSFRIASALLYSCAFRPLFRVSFRFAFRFVSEFRFVSKFPTIFHRGGTMVNCTRLQTGNFLVRPLSIQRISNNPVKNIASSYATVFFP